MVARTANEESIFCEALEHQSAEAQAAYLQRACGGDDDLRRRVEALLKMRDTHASFLAQPAVFEMLPAQNSLQSAVDVSGTVIGSYRLLERIGEGGFGAVYMAEQREPVQRRVALKIIKAGMDTQQVIVRFEAERQALAMMDHPNIARVLDAGATDARSPLGPGRPYFVMELVKGVPITQYCDDNRLAPRQRLALFMDVCHAVQHAHQKGIIHRDLKPSNVMVSRYDDKPMVKIIDFGIAKAIGGKLTDKTLFTEMRHMIGTPAYMSPEQAGLSDLDIDTRSDIYSLGVLQYELLTGTTPFDAARLRSADFDELRRIIREEEPPRPSTRVSSLGYEPTPSLNGSSESGSPATCSSSAATIARVRQTDPKSLARALTGELDWVVMKCLEKDRTRRYETANALALDVERYLKNEPVLASPPSRVYRFRKFVRRNRATVTATAVLSGSLLAGMAGTTFGLLRAEQRFDEAEEARDLAEKRAEETQQVADFQAAMLTEIDIEAMGRGIKDRFRKQIRAALEPQYLGEVPNRRKRTPEEIEAELAAFDVSAEAAQTADVARQVLDEYVLGRAAKALQTQFADQPLVQARLHDAIGHAYRDLGLYREAEPHLRTALDLRKRELGPEHELVADSVFELAWLLLDKDDYDAAEPIVREGLALERSLHGEETEQLAEFLVMLAAVRTGKGDEDEAERLYRQSLAMRRAVLGDEHPRVADGMASLARFLTTERGDFEAAEPLFHEALAILRKAWGDENSQVAATLLALGEHYAIRGDYAAAEPPLRQSLAMHRKLFGDNHPYVANSAHRLGRLLRVNGDFVAAEPLLREAMAIARKEMGNESPLVHMCLLDLANLLQKKGDYAAAEPVHRELLAFAERTLQPDSPNYWQLPNVRSKLGGALAGQGAALVESDAQAAIAKFTEAEPLLVESGTWLIQNADRVPPHPRPARLREALERVIVLYESWDAVAPNSGKAEQAAQWRARLETLSVP
jgi:eukaryotic-like serine/threonine-protein kinase